MICSSSARPSASNATGGGNFSTIDRFTGCTGAPGCAGALSG